MTVIRILVANDVGAVTFDSPEVGTPLIERSRIPFEDGRRKDSEVEADRRGSGKNPGTGHGQSFGRAHAARDQAIARFTKVLCDDLHRAHASGHFDELIMVAPAPVLGELRKHLDKRLSRHVRATLTKDWQRPTAALVSQKLEDALRRPRAVVG